ncbi:conjugal transfer protein TraO [Runella limosa]|uniref:conjugal transfer protein TraO n=1 Tax=Runella limosa TaxID=370978 RepID=UPI00048FB25F|nr:conjugal transfer protein TraO [Runella limosa]
MRGFILLIIGLISTICNAQTHLRNQQFVDVQLGAYDHVFPGITHFAVRAGIGKYTKKVIGNQFFVGYSHKETPLTDNTSTLTSAFSIPVDHYFVGAQSEVPLFYNAHRTVFFKLPFSVIVGYESINKNTISFGQYSLQSRSDILLGGCLGAEIELYNFTVGVRQQINLTSKYQKFSTFPYLGYKLHLFR